MNIITKISGLISQIMGYINSCGEYITYIKTSVTSIFSGNSFPPIIVTMALISIVLLVLYFIRGR